MRIPTPRDPIRRMLAMAVIVAVSEAALPVAAEDATPTTSEETSSMRPAEHDRRIDYIELPSTDLEATKAFYSGTFGWVFTDWGPEYVSFSGAGVDGGFRRSEVAPPSGGTLVVLFAVDLEAAEARVLDAGGTIVRETFSFPGGRRFHFADPSGNELAIWSDR